MATVDNEISLIERPAAMFATRRTAASSYRRLDLETAVAQADRHQLVAMLFDGASAAIAQARHQLAAGQIAAKGEATGRAVRIIEEGLKASLDARGGELASNLHALYEYMACRLLSANLASDDSQYREVGRMIEQLRDAWAQIGPKVRASPMPVAGAVPAHVPMSASPPASARIAA